MFRRLLAALMTLLLHGGGFVDADDLLDDLDDDGRHRPHVHAPPPREHAASSAAESPAAPDTRSSHPFVGLISVDADPADGVLASALSACRDRGDLKIQVRAPHADPETIRVMCAAHGFTFSRRRESPIGSVLEFYTDIYFSPSGTGNLPVVSVPRHIGRRPSKQERSATTPTG